MLGASVSELYLLIKSLINIGRAVDLCVITKKKYTAYTGTLSQLGLAMIHKHAAHRLVQHMQVVEVALTNMTALKLSSFTCTTGSLLRAVEVGVQ